MNTKYFKILNSNADIYIGKNSGKKIIESIDEAKQSITIVSPYLSANSLDRLIKKSQEGVKVTVITSDTKRYYQYDHSQRKIVEKTIQQFKNFDKSIEIEKEHKLSLFNFLKVLTIIFGLIGSRIIYKFTEKGVNIAFILLYILVFAIIFCVLHLRLLHYKHIPIYSYSYNYLLDVRYLSMQDFIHTKLFVIDDEIAYLGSTNFTVNGLHNNIETCVTVRGEEAIKVKEYVSLMLQECTYTPIEEIINRYFIEPLY